MSYCQRCVDENPEICINKSDRLSECCEKCGEKFKYSHAIKETKK